MSTIGHLLATESLLAKSADQLQADIAEVRRARCAHDAELRHSMRTEVADRARMARVLDVARALVARALVGDDALTSSSAQVSALADAIRVYDGTKETR